MKTFLFILIAFPALAQQQINVTLSFTAEEVKFARLAWQSNNDTRSSNGQPTLTFGEYAQQLADAASRQVVQQGQQLARREVTRHLAKIPFDTLTNVAAQVREVASTNEVTRP